MFRGNLEQKAQNSEFTAVSGCGVHLTVTVSKKQQQQKNKNNNNMEFLDVHDYDINKQLSLLHNMIEFLENSHIFIDDRNGPSRYYAYRSMFHTCILQELELAWQQSTLHGLLYLYQVFISCDETMLPNSIHTALLALTPVLLRVLVSLPPV